MNNLNEKLKNIPNSNGIYMFYNKTGKIIYIGKSVNLKSRIGSYFNSLSKLNFAKQKMVKLIENIEIIVTNNETESLILETNLIKKHLPKYNILMKDGKNHIYIKITNEQFPKIIKTRFKNDKGVYFGPYISSYYVTNILKILKEVFGYGVGDHNFFKNHNSYNLDKYIFKNDYKIEDYNNIIKDIKEFLNGKTTNIKHRLEQKMKEKAKNLQFEEAQKIKEKLDSIKILEENQIVRDGVKGDYNVINIIEKFEKIYVGLIEIKNGKIIGFHNYDIENSLKEDKKNLFKFVIEKIWSEELEKDKIIFIIPNIINNFNNLIKIEIPQKGIKKELLELCYKNTYEYAYKSHLDSLSTKGFTKKNMLNILNILGYKEINKNIIFECNDISHISGNYTVASRSIIENGKSNNQKYKRFKIKNLEQGKIDDFNSLKEIISRRLIELEKLKNLPDLIIIDGGKGQLSSVNRIIKDTIKNTQNNEYKNLLEKLQIIGIAKKEEELFLPNQSYPILLNKDSLELRLIQKIRDEAHRFAITYNRNSRIKSMKKNILEELPGFGPKTRKKILKLYGSIEKIKDINKEELKKLLKKTQIETLENHGFI